MAQYSKKGSKTLTWLTMKKQVRSRSKPAAYLASILAPEKRAMRRQKARCSQSCLRGFKSREKAMSTGTEKRKFIQLIPHKRRLRSTPQTSLICTRPRRREPPPVRGTAGCALRHRSSHRRAGRHGTPHGARRGAKLAGE